MGKPKRKKNVNSQLQKMSNTDTQKTSIEQKTNGLSVQQNSSNQAKICMTAFLNISNN